MIHSNIMRIAALCSLVLTIHAFVASRTLAKNIFSGNVANKEDEQEKKCSTNLAASRDWPLDIMSPANVIGSVWEDMDNVFSPLYRMASGLPALASPSGISDKIAFDVKETDKEYEVLADVPGMRKEDMEITVRDRILTLKAERRKEDIQEGENYRRVERYRGWLSRSMHLPQNAGEQDIHAEYKDGVLKVSIPKIETGKGTSIIPVTIE